ncbi:uncharacterized protein PFL1_03794 [Pseudozyma flocculosa PF-1]|uniref:Uncharacterized protein n=1 Tax=Pseudozyma flocculosa PF-1 TaxID=1277687 RepID=A0A061HD22_9BASI|nr:uncharacterized protein PFL1_03794 [Pseudozyma flocculosa PF-1]EPQ28491.1 hypothetical protein PFL1_03794 [Pseudozyma flocculosa PF-1]
METHMTTLGATLLAINKRQAAARRRTRTGVNATPFTTAVLNRERLDIITYIRDADQHTEANLFWYPPPPQSQPNAGPSQYVQRQPHHHHRTGDRAKSKALEAQEAEQLLAPRMPEPRHVQPPTPLRQTLSSRNRADLAGNTAGATDDPATDIKTLLLAAQKLNDDYRSAPKARKHIKGLLKKHAELARAVREFEQRSQANEARIRSIRDGKLDPTGSNDAAAPSAGRGLLAASAGRSTEIQTELARIRQATQKEELEILALEELISELKQEAKTKRSAAANVKRTAQPDDQRAGSEVQAIPARAPSADRTVLQETDLPRPAPALVDQAAAPPSTNPDVAADLEPADGAGAAADEGAGVDDGARETADFHETLRLLRLVASGGIHRNVGDTSLGSSHTFATQTSQATEASSAAPSSAALGATAPYTPDTAMTAYVVLRMMSTPSPHQVNIEELKMDGHRWWAEAGREAYEVATRADAIDDRPSSAEIPTDGQNLARKSIYGMVSKQLFTLKRQKGVGTIEFAR